MHSGRLQELWRWNGWVLDMATVTATFLQPDGTALASSLISIFSLKYDTTIQDTVITKKAYTETTNGSGAMSATISKGVYRLVLEDTGDRIDFEVPDETGTFTLKSISKLPTTPTL